MSKLEPLTGPLATEEHWRLGLVAKLNKFNAWVRVGDTEAVLPIRGMKWASKYDRNSGENELTIDDVEKALEEGDVVWVRRADEKKQAHPPSGNAELGLVEVELRHRLGDLRVGENPDLLTLREEALDLVEFLEVDD